MTVKSCCTDELGNINQSEVVLRLPNYPRALKQQQIHELDSLIKQMECEKTIVKKPLPL